MDLPEIKVPGKKGLLWIGGMGALALGGVIDIPLAVVLASVPVIDRYISDAGDGGSQRRTAAHNASANGSSPRGRSGRTAGGGLTPRSCCPADSDRGTAHRGSTSRICSDTGQPSAHGHTPLAIHSGSRVVSRRQPAAAGAEAVAAASVRSEPPPPSSRC